MSRSSTTYVLLFHSLVVELAENLFERLLVIVMLLHQHLESLQAIHKLDAPLALLGREALDFSVERVDL